MMYREWSDAFETVLRSFLPMLDKNTEIDPDASLTDLGLDSISLVSLLVGLEKAFDVLVPDEALTLDTFETPQFLWSVIDDLLKKGDT